MTRASAWCVGFVCLLAWGQAVDAQGRRDPTDVELKASYCLAIKQEEVTFLPKFIEEVKRFPVGKSQEVIDSSVKDLEASLKQERENVERLESYLFSKKDADPSALLAALNRGKRDLELQRQRTTGLDCHKQCGTDKTDACTRSCLLKDLLTRRIWQCESLDFLPY